jgi:hypothetical protein
MPVTRYYPGTTESSTPSVGPTGEQSAVLPNGTNNNNPGSLRRYSRLQTTKPSTAQYFGVGSTFNSLAQTGRQSAFVGYGYYELGPQTIPAGDWAIAWAASEGNNSANSYLALSIYVWRPSTPGVVGYVYDSTAELGTEWSTSITSRTATVSGSSVTVQNGDVLVIELWQTAAQGVGMTYAQQLEVEAVSSASDITTNGGASTSGWVDAPDELVPKGQYKLVADSQSYTLTGFAADLELGRALLADSRAFVLTANPAGLERIFPALLADLATFTLTGNGAELRATRNPLLADSAGYTLTGSDADLVKRAPATAWGTGVWGGGTWGAVYAKEMAAETGSFSLTGNAADLIYTPVVAFTLTADSQSYTLTGNAAGLTYAPRLLADTRSYALTGVVTDLLRGRVMLADTQSYALTGIAANLLAGLRLVGDTRSYTLTGNAIQFSLTRQLSADSASYTLTGAVATLRANRIVALDTGSYTLTGQDAQLVQGLAIVSETGPFFLTRYTADLRFNRELIADTQSYALTGVPVVLTTALVVTPATATVTLQAVPPSPAAGGTSIPVGTAALRLGSVAPAVTSLTTLSVAPAVLSAIARPPSAVSGMIVAAPAVIVRDIARAPAVVAGASTSQVGASSVRVLARSPFIIQYIPMQVARVIFDATAPAISGGGGPGAVFVLPKKTGD